MMDRRAFITVVGVSFLAPLAGGAQQAGKVHRIGLLGPTPMAPSTFEAFKQGLAELGYQQGRNLIIGDRHGEEPLLSGLAGDLVRLNVDVIYAGPHRRGGRQGCNSNHSDSGH